MRTPLPSHLGTLREGLALLRCHPLLSFGLALLAMVLAQLGPALELAAKVGPSLLIQPIFGFAGLLPLEMYFIPRLQAQLDAELRDAPANPTASWPAVFDGRWLKAFLLRLGLSVAIGLGLFCFLVPGILLLTLFGWAPMRMLLRGDSALASLRWSQAAMAATGPGSSRRCWPCCWWPWSTRSPRAGHWTVSFPPRIPTSAPAPCSA